MGGGASIEMFFDFSSVTMSCRPAKYSLLVNLLCPCTTVIPVTLTVIIMCHMLPNNIALKNGAPSIVERRYTNRTLTAPDITDFGNLLSISRGNIAFLG